MLKYAVTVRGNTDVPFFPTPCNQQQACDAEPQGREAGPGTTTFHKSVVVTYNADWFLVGIAFGQVCLVVEDHDDDLPAEYPSGFIVGFLDALSRARKTYPQNSWGRQIQSQWLRPEEQEYA